MVFANVMMAAAHALNQIEDRGRERGEERSRVANVTRDRSDAERAIETLRRLLHKYVDQSTAREHDAALTALETALLPWLTDEAETWLQPTSGRPPREDLEHFALLIRKLHDDGWGEIGAAATAVAAVVDAVWSEDPRTKDAAVAKALWGAAGGYEAPDRLVEFTERLRKLAYPKLSENPTR
jgi:hypothetical protein